MLPRKLLYCFLPLTLIVCSALGSDTVDIVGPTTCEANGRPIRLDVTGLNVEELLQGQGRLMFYPREGVELWDAASWSGQPYALFFANRPGKYLVLIVLVHQNQLVYAEHEITVTGEGPDPGPDPDPPDPNPDPDPDPEGPYQIAFFSESDDVDNYTRDQRTMLSGLQFRDELGESGHLFIGSFDPDSGSVSGGWSCRDGSCDPRGIPDSLRPWWQAIDGKQMPVVCFAPRDGGSITVHPLPDTLDKFRDLLEGGAR